MTHRDKQCIMSDAIDEFEQATSDWGYADESLMEEVVSHYPRSMWNEIYPVLDKRRMIGLNIERGTATLNVSTGG